MARTTISHDGGSPALAASTHPSLVASARLEEHRRLRVAYIDQQLHPADKRPQYYALVAGLLALILFVAFRLGPLPVAADSSCWARPSPGVNWSNCTFEALAAKHANLAGANLRNASLRSANLMGARLIRADMSYSELVDADLSYAELSRAVLVGANLQQADLTYAHLTDADLAYADLSGAVLGGADLSGARLDHAIWIDGNICTPGLVGRCLPQPSPASSH